MLIYNFHNIAFVLVPKSINPSLKIIKNREIVFLLFYSKVNFISYGLNGAVDKLLSIFV